MATPDNKKGQKRLRQSPSSSEKLFSNDSFNLFHTSELDTLEFDALEFDANDSNEKKSIFKCTCKNSKCLKLYCACFGNGVSCSDNCSCSDCHNKNGFEKDIQRAKSIITRRNPKAFEPKIIHGTRHSKGCTCKTTRCLKKYCECYRAGVHCTQSCNCLNCLNGKNGIFETNTKNSEQLLSSFVDALQ